MIHFSISQFRKRMKNQGTSNSIKSIQIFMKNTDKYMDNAEGKLTNNNVANQTVNVHRTFGAPSNIFFQPMRSLLDAHDLSKLLGVSYQTVKEWSRKGRLKSIQIHLGRRLVKYDSERVAERIKSGKILDG
jgi:hypothetical protein